MNLTLKKQVRNHRNKIILLLLLSASFFSEANSIYSSQPMKIEKGWFWGEREKEETAKEKPDAEFEPALADQEEKEQDCSNPIDWTLDCGFVHPGKDFDFSQLQYKELTKQLAMHPEDTKKVLQYQKFVHWAVDQAVTAAKTAEWNIMQNQDMNPFIENPVGSFGMRAAASALTDHNRTVLQDIAQQGGFLVFFTRNDCIYCHKMYPTNWLLAQDIGLDLYNAALDGQCLKEVEEKFCYDKENIELVAKYLDVFLVPDLFLYLPKDDFWVRVSSGVESQETIKRRIVFFFSAVKNASQKGLQAAAEFNRPAVNFESKNINERAAMGIGAAAGILQETKK